MEGDNFTRQMKISAVDAKEFLLQTEFGEFTLTLDKRVRFTPADPKSGLQFFNKSQQPKFKQITGSNNFFLALTETGNIYYWGRIIFAAAGQAKNMNTPVLFNLPKKFEYISCSKQNCAAIDDEGNLYVWGYNKDNYLNLTASRGNLQESYIYLPVPVPHKVKFSSVAVGLHHFIAISEFGNVYIWGSNREKQLGLVETKRVFKPRLVSFPTKAKKVVCGDYHSAILLEDRNLYIIGYTDESTNKRCDYELRLIHHHVQDVACWNGKTVYVTSVRDEKYVPKPNIIRCVLQSCSWISFCGPEIHVGIKHIHEGYFKEKLRQIQLENNFQSPQAYEVLKFGYTPLHHAVNQGNIAALLQLMEEGHDMNAKDYLDRSPFDLVIEHDNLEMFQIFLQNYSTRGIEVKFSAAAFMQVYIRGNSAISFPNILLCGSVKSLVKGIAKLLKKLKESTVINNPNYDIMFDYLQNDAITLKCVDHLIYLRPLAKFLKIGKVFDWFMKMHELSNGVLSTKIFLDYLCQTIQQNEEVSDLIISQARTFFSVRKRDTGLIDYIPLILDEIMHIMEEDTELSKFWKQNRATTFLSATLSSVDGRTYVLRKYTLYKYYENLCKHPQHFTLLKFFVNEVQAEIPISNNAMRVVKAYLEPVSFNGEECVTKKFTDQSMFFKEILVTSLIFHPNIIHAVGFAQNSDLNSSRIWSCMVVLPRYQELLMVSNHRILQKMVYLHKLASAIDELHQCGIIHVDIKPENVLFDVVTRQIKLIDFSTCHLKTGMDDNLTKFRPNHVGYTERWAGIEFNAENPKISFGTDVFLFGTLMANFILPAFVPRFEPKRERFFTQQQIESLERVLSKKVALHFISLIYGCVNYNISGRLTIENILNKLEEIIKKMLKGEMKNKRSTI